MCFTDLLADVIIYPDGFVKVVDIDELVTALNQKLISEDTLKKSLLNLSSLLEIIYSIQWWVLFTSPANSHRSQAEGWRWHWQKDGRLQAAIRRQTK